MKSFQKVGFDISQIAREENSPVIFAWTEDDEEESKDTVCAYSNPSGVKSGRVLPGWMEEKSIVMEVQESHYGEALKIDESDLEADSLLFILERTLYPPNSSLLSEKNNIKFIR